MSEKIHEIIGKYTYGKANALIQILSGEDAITYNLTQKSIRIPNFYFRDFPEFEGECSELVFKLEDELKSIEPESFFYFARGTEPDFFFKGNHCLIVKSPERLLEHKEDDIIHPDGIEHDPKYKERIKEKTIQIIDPSLNIVQDYDKSGYCIKGLFDFSYPYRKPSDLLLGDKEANPGLVDYIGWRQEVPLAFNNEGELIYLKCRFSKESSNPDSIFTIEIQKPKEDSIELPLTTDQNIIKSEKIEELIGRLFKTSLEEKRGELITRKISF